jgi:hypothetical protein
MFRSVLACLLLAVPSSTAPATHDTLLFVNYPNVHRVDCVEGRGTAFRVGSTHWISVAHVASLHGCTVDGAPIAVTQLDYVRDFARFDTKGSGNGLRVNCGGFVAGEWVWAIGHARGLPFQTAMALYVTYAKMPDGKRILIGPATVIPGMSGGPLLDSSGAVVGTINAYIPGTEISLSRDLRDTSICGANIA